MQKWGTMLAVLSVCQVADKIMSQDLENIGNIENIFIVQKGNSSSREQQFK
jgi:hypothetical protein